MFNQHYIINLKRRPERLFTWVGAQDQMGFVFEYLIVFESVDGKAFRNKRAIAEYAVELGFAYWEPLLKGSMSYLLLLPKHSPYRETTKPKKRYQNNLKTLHIRVFPRFHSMRLRCRHYQRPQTRWK